MITHTQTEKNTIVDGTKDDDVVLSVSEDRRRRTNDRTKCTLQQMDLDYLWTINFGGVIEVILLFIFLVLLWTMEEQAENYLWETDKDNSCCLEKCYRPEPNVNASRSMHGTEGKGTERQQHNI